VADVRLFLRCAFMDDRGGFLKLGMGRLLREPLVHFFVLGALLFAANSLLRPETREVVVTPGLKADLWRRFQDDRRRPPNPKEQDEILTNWRRDEALYREALERGLYRTDVNVRSVLVERMRNDAALEVSVPLPSDAELESFIRANPKRYERPRRYDFQFLTFSKSDANVAKSFVDAQAALQHGSKPSELGRPLTGAKLTQEDLAGRVPAELAAHIAQLALGEWTRVEGEREIWLVRVQRILGGFPELREIREAAAADWTERTRALTVSRELQKTVDLYHFKEVPDAN
jgi:hypothetical protein